MKQIKSFTGKILFISFLFAGPFFLTHQSASASAKALANISALTEPPAHHCNGPKIVNTGECADINSTKCTDINGCSVRE